MLTPTTVPPEAAGEFPPDECVLAPLGSGIVDASLVPSLPRFPISRSAGFPTAWGGVPGYRCGLIETAPSDVEQYLPNVMIGICAADGETGKELVDEFIDDGDAQLACAGLRVLITEDRSFAVDRLATLRDSADPYEPELVANVSRVLRGEWEDHPD